MSLPAGTRLGPYEILAPIGAGGMGEVYRARDTRLDREVAIKVLPERHADSPAMASRFQREAKAVAALSHVNILALFDVGVDQGISFAVMELLEGETLKTRLDRGPLPWREAVRIGLDVAEGLAAAHGKGVIHRDLKPANIFLTSDGHAKILDFGLARIKPPVSANQTSVPTETESGMVIGSVGYMSPEQVKGERADEPGDIFSFGCVLYEMLSGRRAFVRETAAQTLAAILESDPPELAGSGLKIPAALEPVVAHCMAKNPQRRFQSAQDLAFALSSISDAGTHAPGVAKRPRALWTAAALAAILIAGAVYWLGRPLQRVDSLAILPFANVGSDPGQEYLSEGITENLINTLSQLRALRVTARSLAFRYSGPRVDPQQAGRDLRVRAVLTGRVMERNGALNIQAELLSVADGGQLWGRQYSRNLSDILAVQQEIVREISATLGFAQTDEQQKRLSKRSTGSTDAYRLYLRGRYYWNRRTEQTLKRAVEYFQQAIDKDPGYALAYAGLADCYAVYNSYQVELPRESGPKAKAAAIKALAIDNTVAEAHASLGMTHMSYEWDWAAAEREFQRAIELEPGYATAHHWYAVLLAATGRSEQAIASLKRAQDADPLSLIVNSDLGLVMHFARRDDEAIVQVRKALELDQNFAAGRRPLGRAYEQKGMYAEAIAEFQKALEASPGSPFALGSLGHAYAVSGQRDKARLTLSEMLELSKRRYVSPFDIAVVYAGMDDKERALDWLRKALDDHSLEMIFLKVNPRFDWLHGEPRFVELLRRIGLSS